MKCAACGYQFWNSDYEGQEPFITIEGALFKDNNKIPVKLYACPKCGTIKMQVY